MLKKIMDFGRMIKFSHTVFALPFALASVILANRETPITFWKFFWIIIAMIGARSAAMGFNRIADADIDAANPRTSGREIPSGKLGIRPAVIFVVSFSCLFILAAFMLGNICFYLSFPVLLILFMY